VFGFNQMSFLRKNLLHYFAVGGESDQGEGEAEEAVVVSPSEESGVLEYGDENNAHEEGLDGPSARFLRWEEGWTVRSKRLEFARPP
jgi:hypothetical protein